MLKRLFVEHPQSVGESYGEHFSVASWYGVRLLGAGVACMVHALLPFLFVRTGSATIERLHGHMNGRLGPLGAGQPHGHTAAPNVGGVPVKEG
ncbi:MAG: DUF6356 family protein [Alphaproteobacteria bacterium]|nr:DUF6356 family protein [Alphaproteobacteria bacterium]